MPGPEREVHARTVSSPEESASVWMGNPGGEETGGTFALVEYPISPRALADAPSRHEDEYTYVLEGEIGARAGNEVRVARPGDLVSKPRGVPHAFWNAGGDAPALETIVMGS